MQELWLWGFTRGSALLTCIYEFSVFHKVPGLKNRERHPSEDREDTVYSDCLKQRPVP